jgi:hypothetical protein
MQSGCTWKSVGGVGPANSWQTLVFGRKLTWVQFLYVRHALTQAHWDLEQRPETSPGFLLRGTIPSPHSHCRHPSTTSLLPSLPYLLTHPLHPPSLISPIKWGFPGCNPRIHTRMTNMVICVLIFKIRTMLYTRLAMCVEYITKPNPISNPNSRYRLPWRDTCSPNSRK